MGFDSFHGRLPSTSTVRKMKRNPYPEGKRSKDFIPGQDGYVRTEMERWIHRYETLRRKGDTQAALRTLFKIISTSGRPIPPQIINAIADDSSKHADRIRSLFYKRNGKGQAKIKPTTQDALELYDPKWARKFADELIELISIECEEQAMVDRILQRYYE